MDFGDDFSWFAILKEARQEQSSRTSKEDEGKITDLYLSILLLTVIIPPMNFYY